MGINVAWFDWQLAIYTTPLTFRDWKQCHEKYFYFVKRAIPIGNFVGYHPSIILYFWSCGGTYPPGWTVLSIHEVIWLCHTMDLGPKLDCCKKPFWYQDQILYVYCWVRVPMRLNFIQHGHHCGLIWLNNLLGYFETPSSVMMFIQDPNFGYILHCLCYQFGMPLTGYFWTVVKHLRYKDQILDIILVKCGLIWLNTLMRLDLTEHWQFTQHPSYFETQSSVMKSMFTSCYPN